MTALKLALGELQEKFTSSQSTNWLQEIVSSFKDDLDFEEILACRR